MQAEMGRVETRVDGCDRRGGTHKDGESASDRTTQTRGPKVSKCSKRFRFPPCFRDLAGRAHKGSGTFTYHSSTPATAAHCSIASFRDIPDHCVTRMISHASRLSQALSLYDHLACQCQLLRIVRTPAIAMQRRQSEQVSKPSRHLDAQVDGIGLQPFDADMSPQRPVSGEQVQAGHSTRACPLFCLT